MKSIFLFFCFSTFFCFSIVAQEKVWLDANKQLTEKEKASFYRVFSSEKSTKKKVTDYYVSGVKAQEFYVVESVQQGKFSEFYETEELKVIGFYKDGLKDGVWKTYYKNGKIKEKGKYRNNLKVGVWKTFYQND